jgi:hypothetical protein
MAGASIDPFSVRAIPESERIEPPYRGDRREVLRAMAVLNRRVDSTRDEAKDQ